MKTKSQFLDLFWQRGPGFEKIDDGTVGAFIDEVLRDAIEACAATAESFIICRDATGNGLGLAPLIADAIRKSKPLAA